MSENVYEDRRMFHRFDAKMPLQFKYLELEIKGKGELQDISAAGIGLLTQRRLNLYAPMAIKVDIPFNKDPFYFTGEVVWVKRVDFHTYRAGIKFNSPCLIGVWKVLNGMRLNGEEITDSVEAEHALPQGVLSKCARALNVMRIRFANFLW